MTAGDGENMAHAVSLVRGKFRLQKLVQQMAQLSNQYETALRTMTTLEKNLELQKIQHGGEMRAKDERIAALTEDVSDLQSDLTVIFLYVMSVADMPHTG